MKDWFYALAPRERLMVTGCAVVVVAALLYLMLWAPFAERRAQLALSVAAQQETLAWMRQASLQVQQARQLRPNVAALNDSRSLLSIVDSTATQAGVRKPITRMEPEGDDGVKLSMENADFDATIRWLGTLKRSHNVDVVQATVTPSDAPGQVDTRLSLQRP
jgi:general secretion pathway protein M